MIFDYTGSQKETISRLALSDASTRVLDVGCGDGQKTAYVAQHVECAVGVDPDETLVRAAKDKYRRKNLWFQVAQAESFCFSDAAFDTILFNESLHHIPVNNQIKALRECQRVLQAEGRLLIIEPVHGSGSSGKILKIFNDEKESRQRAINSIESIIDSGFKLSSKKQIRAVFSCNGFDDLYEYYTMSEPDGKWSENYKGRIKNRLERCKRNSKGDFLIDYYSSVWLLTKR